MRRRLQTAPCILLLLFSACQPAIAQDSRAEAATDRSAPIFKRTSYGAIDLDVPGNLEALARANPDHYAKIQRILVDVPQRPPAEGSVASWMRVEFQAHHVSYTDLVMTSLPPKKRLKFSLDDTSYVAVVTLAGWDAKPKRVREAPEPTKDVHDR